MTEFPISAIEADWPADNIERDLIEQARHDRDAFAQLYRRHYAPIAAYVYRRVGDSHASEDLVAEVFIAAMRSIRRYRHRGLPFRSWLYRIATNTVNRWSRKRRRAGWFAAIRGADHREPTLRGAKDGPRGDAGARIPSRTHGSGNPLPRECEAASDSPPADRGESDVARRAMLELPAHQQAAMALHYLEGLPLENVAAICGCRLGTVKSRLARGRESLRARLEQGR